VSTSVKGVLPSYPVDALIGLNGSLVVKLLPDTAEIHALLTVVPPELEFTTKLLIAAPVGYVTVSSVEELRVRTFELTTVMVPVPVC
jgi:hypothetical protein